MVFDIITAFKQNIFVSVFPHNMLQICVLPLHRHINFYVDSLLFYELIVTIHSYTDTDECAAGLDNCHPNATCSNSVGSFSCDCYDDFFGDGNICIPGMYDNYIVLLLITMD